MRINLPDRRKEYRTPGLCEVCRKPCRAKECVHIFSVGAGRLDIRCNMVSCGSTPGFCCDCHSSNHQKTNGKIVIQEQLLEISAKREKCKAEDIEPVIWFIRRLDQYSPPEVIMCRAECELSLSQQALAIKELREAGKL